MILSWNFRQIIEELIFLRLYTQDDVTHIRYMYISYYYKHILQGQIQYRNLHRSRPEPETFMGPGPIQGQLFYGNRPAPATSTRAGQRQQPPQQQGQWRDDQGNRPKPEISVGPGISHGSPKKQVWARDIFGNKPKPANFARAGLSQWPLWEQTLDNNLYRSRYKGTTI